MKSNLMLYESDFLDDESVVVRKHFLKKGSEFPPHWHDYFEFEIIVSGEGEHIYNNHRYKIEEGQAHLMSYYDFHAMTVSKDIMLYCVHFDKSALCAELSQFLETSMHKLHFKFNKEETLKITEKIEEIITESNSKPHFYKQMKINLINSVLIYLIRKCTEDGLYKMPKLIQKITFYTHSNFRQELSLDVLSKEFSVSRNHLGATFKKWFGMPYNEYLNNIRLKYACNLLTSTDLSVKEIAFESGYHSVEYFLFKFKNSLNLTPGEYRKATR